MNVQSDCFQVETVEREQLGPSQKKAMFELLNFHFEGVTREQFESDLEEKNKVILLYRGERLLGFSTLLAYSSVFEGESINVVYSGDTIVAPEGWGSAALPRTWIAEVRAIQTGLPPGRYFWMLLTSGFRTYRFLPVFWKEFYPCFRQPTPAWWQGLRDHLAADRFGSAFDSRCGLVRFQRPQRLRLGLEKIPAGRLEDPHIAFFAGQNPGHGRGDELVCLTELGENNLTAAGRRMVRANGI